MMGEKACFEWAEVRIGPEYRVRECGQHFQVFKKLSLSREAGEWDSSWRGHVIWGDSL